MAATPERRPRRRGVVLIVLGAVIGLVGIAGILGGAGVLWADKTQRDSAGYFTTSTHRFATGSYALAHEGIDVTGIPNWIDVGKVAKIRIRATSTTGRPLFVGIARDRLADRYLANVAHANVTDVSTHPFEADYTSVGGPADP